ncbi:MAG: C1 family peptidase [Actinomycetia bacterium]|nr:C1 family peptidase [Actinomycetes bacterium]
MKRILAALPAFALAITVVWGVPSAAHADPAAAPPHAMGALAPTQTALPKLMATATPLGSADLRQYAVPPGQQGGVGSCVTWAVAYDMMGWYAQETGANARAFAPMYMYSQIGGGKDDGALITDGLKLAVTQGVDTQDDYTYGNYNYMTQPTAAQMANAANSKFTGYTTLFATSSGNVGALAQTSIENALSQGEPVAIGFQVRNGFMYYGNNLAVADDDTSTTVLGGHAVLALAYDANGLIIENSWGTD